jgi:hypothetical protein
LVGPSADGPPKMSNQFKPWFGIFQLGARRARSLGVHG